jgi:hypothetical protein
MPGIITHNKILRESIGYLQKKKKKNYLLRSIQTLFMGKDRLAAALFGSIGPNIFDYIPLLRKSGKRGDSIAFRLHDSDSRRLIESMVHLLLSQNDINNEWTSLQRAYLYGFISHIVSDALLHPFIFYFSGFPDTSNKGEMRYYREQYLLYQYTIDSYIQKYRNDSPNFRFSVQDMLPVEKRYGLQLLSIPIKSMILETINSEFPEIYKSITWKDTAEADKESKNWVKHAGPIDFIPYWIQWTYRIKMTQNTRMREFLINLRKKQILVTDFTLLYPQQRSIDLHIVNHYRERWQYPVGQTAIHYESFENLFQITCEKIVEAWEGIESALFNRGQVNLHNLMLLNLYTGVNDHDYSQMKQKNPIRVKY